MPSSPNNLPFVARPTVRIEGQEVERVTQLLVGMTMHEHQGGLSALELRFTNIASLTGGGAEVAFDAGGDLRLGAAVTVGGGDATSPAELFRGTITGLEALHQRGRPPELAVLAEDALQKARLKRRSRVFEDQSVADIVRQITAEHGLTAQVSGLDQNFGPQVQMNETDLGFLRRLLARVDADPQVVGTELQVSARSGVRRGQLELDAGRDFHFARVLADLVHQASGTTVKGWDIRNGQAISADGQENAPGPGSGDRGGEVLERTLGARAKHTGRLAELNAADPAPVVSAQRLQPAAGQTHLRVFQPVHRTFTVALLEARCDTFGFPRLDPRKIESAGLVVRRVAERDGQPQHDAHGRYLLEGWRTLGKTVAGWVPFPQGSVQPTCDPVPARRCGPRFTGQADVDRRLRPAGTDYEEAVSPLFPVPPAVSAQCGHTLLFGVVPVTSSARAGGGDPTRAGSGVPSTGGQHIAPCRPVLESRRPHRDRRRGGEHRAAGAAELARPRRRGRRPGWTAR